jgi:hypothetical protein
VNKIYQQREQCQRARIIRQYSEFQKLPAQMIEKEIFPRSLQLERYIKSYRKEKPCLSFLYLPIRIPAASVLRPSILLMLAQSACLCGRPQRLGSLYDQIQT